MTVKQSHAKNGYSNKNIMKKLFLPLAFTAVLAIQGCGNNSNNANDHADSTEMATVTNITSDAAGQHLTAGDTTFANQAAVGGMAEVELGQLAMEKASNTKVKDFASMMVNDHSKANEELKTIASTKNIMLPAGLDSEHAKIKETLTAKSGAEFDEAYVQAMVEGHQKTLALMEAGSQNNQDADLKAFAAKTAPVVKHHLEMIQKIQSEMK
jgi:putative membrane protein